MAPLYSYSTVSDCPKNGRGINETAIVAVVAFLDSLDTPGEAIEPNAFDDRSGYEPSLGLLHD